MLHFLRIGGECFFFSEPYHFSNISYIFPNFAPHSRNKLHLRRPPFAGFPPVPKKLHFLVIRRIFAQRASLLRIVPPFSQNPTLSCLSSDFAAVSVLPEHIVQILRLSLFSQRKCRALCVRGAPRKPQNRKRGKKK